MCALCAANHRCASHLDSSAGRGREGQEVPARGAWWVRMWQCFSLPPPTDLRNVLWTQAEAAELAAELAIYQQDRAAQEHTTPLSYAQKNDLIQARFGKRQESGQLLQTVRDMRDALSTSALEVGTAATPSSLRRA